MKMDLLLVVMKDQSIFKMPNESWQKAFNLEYNDTQEAVAILKRLTHEYWLKRIKSRNPWKERYARARVL